MLDIGSGAGFPGVVLKLALPDLEVRLVEATLKKARFLSEVAARLDLRGLQVTWGRSEDLAARGRVDGVGLWRRRFVWVTGKGLGSLQESTAMAEPFLAAGGVHWTFKGRRCHREIEAAGGYFRQRGYPAYGFGPMVLEQSDIDRVHGIDDRISVDNLVLGIKIARDVIRELCVD